MSGIWKPGIVFDVFGTPVELQQIVRDVLLVAVTCVSLAITPKGVREKNQFSWAPMQEVAKLFIGIFLTMIPVLAMLKAGEAGRLRRRHARGHRARRPAAALGLLLVQRRAQLASSTTRRPTWCSSTSPAATRGADDHAGRHAGRHLGRRRCSWAPTPTSATRPTSWSRPSPKTAASRMPSFFGYMALERRDPAAAVRRHDLHLLRLIHDSPTCHPGRPRRLPRDGGAPAPALRRRAQPRRHHLHEAAADRAPAGKAGRLHHRQRAHRRRAAGRLPAAARGGQHGGGLQQLRHRRLHRAPACWPPTRPTC